MRERTEAKKIAAEEVKFEANIPKPRGRKMTVAKMLAEDERRMSDSQVALMSLDEQLKHAAKLLKPGAKVGSMKFAPEANAAKEETKKEPMSAKATVFSLTAQIS